jgi:hypothetical protein
LKILFDHDVPRPLSRSLGNHHVKTARQMGWGEIDNGLLLDAAEEAGFDVLIKQDFRGEGGGRYNRASKEREYGLDRLRYDRLVRL